VSVLRKAARAKEKKDIKDRYGKSTHQRCPYCGKFSLFRWISRQYKVVKCVRCEKKINLDNLDRKKEY